MADRNNNRKSPGTTSTFPGIIIVIAIVALAVIIYWIVKQPKIAAQPNGPTVQQTKQVRFSHLAVTSDNGAFDIEGQATNQGSRPITRLSVQTQFHALNGATLESETANVTNANGSDLQADPLPPGQTRPVKIELTHAPQGWDGKPPVINITDLQWGSNETQPANAGTGSTSPAPGSNEQSGSGTESNGRASETNGNTTQPAPGSSAAGGHSGSGQGANRANGGR